MINRSKTGGRLHPKVSHHDKKTCKITVGEGGGGSGDSIEEKRNDKGGAKHQKQPPHPKKNISIFFTLAVFS